MSGQGCNVSLDLRTETQSTLDAILVELRRYRRQIEALPAGEIRVKFASGQVPIVRFDLDGRGLNMILDKVGSAK